MQNSATNTDSPFFTLKEAIVYLRISRCTAYRLLQGGKLNGLKVGERWRFTKEDLDASLKRIEHPSKQEKRQ